ncbi:Kazal-type serine protease inhibitor [Telluribacter sp. SYSU D00476]|uniref:Kazal-type serine protease inhibitor family protein n=1 Tax=Telluribacter sp. SYSU D00476 TaxID=2811430 RepID=UPI001FF6FB86|nr:Kazal-type serine protease inhibitor [Telluribacter sp. SYSU D00476]
MQLISKTTLLVLLLWGSLPGCQDQDAVKDCQERPRDDRACYEIYAPVCGCNGKTYPNDCEALAAGITRFTEGPCAKAD